MKIDSTRWMWMLQLGTVLLIPTPMLAQYGMSEIRVQEEVHAVEAVGTEALRARCREGAQSLTSGAEGRDRTDALWAVARCEDSAVPALLVAWSKPLTDPWEYSTLLRVTYSIRDSRLLDAMIEVARDEAADAMHRKAAFLVISEFLNPGSGTGSPASWFRLDDPETLRVGRRSAHWRPPVRGSVPITRTNVEGLAEPLRSLSEESADPQIREIARYLLFLHGVALDSWRWPA